MQYFLRFFLSFLVVTSHFWPDLLPGGEGALAVMGFYVISGYVISLVWLKLYSKSENGFKRFWLNRIVRLYPTFVISSLMGLLIIYLAPDASRAMNSLMVVPWSAAGVDAIVSSGLSSKIGWLTLLPQITLIGHQAPAFWRVPIAFSPNAWSVNMEFYFYLSVSLGLVMSFARTKRFLWVSSIITSLFVLLMAVFGHQIFVFSYFEPYFAINYYQVFYKTPVGIALFFALGAFVYYLPRKSVSNAVKWGLFILMLATPLLPAETPLPIILRLLLMGILCALLLYVWSDKKPKGILKFIGDMSYPLFLLHWPVGAMVSAVSGLEKNSAEFFIYAALSALLASAIVVLYVERPLETLRDKVRPNKQEHST